MAIQNNSSLNPSTNPRRRRKTQSENPRPRWECEAVQLIVSQVESKEWRYALETVASELYDLSHQLRDVAPVDHAGPTKIPYLLLCAIQTKQ